MYRNLGVTVPEDERQQQSLEPTAAPRHRWQRRFLRLCGSQEIDEATLDLDEKSRRRRAAGEPGWRIRCWGTWQILGIGLYELRDMRLRRRHRTFHPLLALRLAGRSLRRQPGVPIAAALTLGLGFGAAAAIYGVYSGFRRPLPVPDGAALHWIRVLDERGRSVPMRHDDFEVLRTANSTFEALGGFASFSATVRFGGKHAVRAQGAAMTPEVFEMLQVIPARGRPLLAADHDAVVVSHDFWVAYLDKDAALGDTLRVDGVDRVVVGVMPEGHRFPFNHDLWTVLEPAAVDSIETVARIRPGSNPELAAADAGRILEELRRERGSEPLGLRVEVPSFTEKRGESGENVALATMLALVIAMLLAGGLLRSEIAADFPAEDVFVTALAVSPSYSAILGADLTGGRGFTASDSLPGEHVAVVSESFARRHLPTADALGQRLRLEQLTGADWLRIVGVVADVAEYAGADERLLARVYVPFARVDPRDAYVVYTGRPAAATGGLRATIAALDPDVAVTGVFGRQAETRVADVMRYVRRIYLTGGVLAMISGVAAAIVALIGLYGALALEVQRRVAEIGVRMALGATYRDVLLHTTIGGLARVGPGLLLGLVMSAGVSPLLGALLGGMNPLDPAVHLGVYFAFLAVAIIAAVVPARHAARLDPVTVLRQD